MTTSPAPATPLTTLTTYTAPITSSTTLTNTEDSTTPEMELYSNTTDDFGVFHSKTGLILMGVLALTTILSGVALTVTATFLAIVKARARTGRTNLEMVNINQA